MYAPVLPGIQSEQSHRTGRQEATAPAANRQERGDHWSEQRDPATGRKYFANVREPYINDAVRAQINAAQADKTYAAFWRLVFKQQAKGRTAAIRANAWRLAALDDVGIKGLAKEAGVHPSTAKRHLKILVEQIGILGMGSSPVTFKRDESPKGTLDENGRPVRGRIVSKTGGREKPIRIWFTPDERHAIPVPKPRIGRKSYGAPCALGSDDGAVLRAHGAPASREEEIRTTPPVAGTDGVGAAVAAGEAGRQEAAEAGGLTAASQEGKAGAMPSPHWPRPDAPAHVAKPAPRPRSPAGTQEPQEKSFAQRAEEWNRRSPEQERIVAEYAAARRAKAALHPMTPPTPDRPSGETAGAHETSPMPDELRADADDLNRLVNSRRRQEADAARAAQRDAYHRDRGHG